MDDLDGDGFYSFLPLNLHQFDNTATKPDDTKPSKLSILALAINELAVTRNLAGKLYMTLTAEQMIKQGLTKGRGKKHLTAPNMLFVPGPWDAARREDYLVSSVYNRMQLHNGLLPGLEDNLSLVVPILTPSGQGHVGAGDMETLSYQRDPRFKRDNYPGVFMVIHKDDIYIAPMTEWLDANKGDPDQVTDRIEWRMMANQTGPKQGEGQARIDRRSAWMRSVRVTTAEGVLERLQKIFRDHPNVLSTWQVERLACWWGREDK